MNYANVFKRLLDILLSITAFILLIPLLLVTALCIKIFDPGPVLFVQQRTGRGGVPFDFYKFRSMPVNTGDIPSDQIGGETSPPIRSGR